MFAQSVCCETSAEAVDAYRDWAGDWHSDKGRRAALNHLRSTNLACWRKVGEPCHADVLLEMAATRSDHP
jgi:hypothetical protein